MASWIAMLVYLPFGNDNSYRGWLARIKHSKSKNLQLHLFNSRMMNFSKSCLQVKSAQRFEQKPWWEVNKFRCCHECIERKCYCIRKLWCWYFGFETSFFPFLFTILHSISSEEFSSFNCGLMLQDHRETYFEAQHPIWNGTKLKDSIM